VQIDYQMAYEVRVTLDTLKNSIRLIEDIGRHASGPYSKIALDVAMELAQRHLALQKADEHFRKQAGAA
jgi:hypothetical protein